jgi:GNAT superfamily N-acetyltransferase
MQLAFEVHDAAFAAFDELEPGCPRSVCLDRVRHRCFLDGDGQPTVRVAAFVPDGLDEVGLLGLYAARPEANAHRAAAVLDAACAWLRASGCKRVVGPVNGSTWYDYRFALCDDSAFMLDPATPTAYLEHWRCAGFGVAERYRSTVYSRDRFCFARAARFGARMSGRGVCATALDAGTFQEALPEIHSLCNEAFAANPYFTRIEYQAFADIYEPLGALLDPRWTRVARDASGGLLGFAFAYPNLLDMSSGDDVGSLVKRSLVIKTVAARPQAAGVGAWLVEQLHQAAYDEGYERVFHALMHDDNPSTQIHRSASQTCRRYVLLGKTL